MQGGPSLFLSNKEKNVLFRDDSMNCFEFDEFFQL